MKEPMDMLKRLPRISRKTVKGKLKCLQQEFQKEAMEA